VTAELAYHREPVTLGKALDRGTDVAQMRTRPHRANSAPHRLVGDLAKPLGLDRRRANAEHATRIAVIAVLDHRDVDVDDVAVLEPLVAGYAVTNNVVDRGADRRRIRLVPRRRVVQRGGDDALDIDLMVVSDAVELAGGNAGFNVRREVIEQLGGD